MMRVLIGILVVAIVMAGGWLTSDLLHRTPAGQRLVARAWDGIVTLAERVGILERSADADDRAREEQLRTVSASEPVSEAEIEREVNLIRFQFADAEAFTRTMNLAGLTEEKLRVTVAEHLRARSWIEKRIGPALAVAEPEVRQFYEVNRTAFAQPQRFRARHIFLAAPEESPPEVIAAKQSDIQGLAIRVLAHEDFTQLAAQASEDEATKFRGGDLGYFSAARMPEAFIAEIQKLQVGELSPPFRSPVGFHIVQLTDSKAPHELSLQEAGVEIALELKNAKRAAAVAALAETLTAPAR